MEPQKNKGKIRIILEAILVSTLLGSAFIVFSKYMRGVSASVALFYFNLFAAIALSFRISWKRFKEDLHVLKSFKVAIVYILAILAYASSFGYLLPTLNDDKVFLVLIFLSLQPLLAILVAMIIFKGKDGIKNLPFFLLGVLFIIAGIIYPKIDMSSSKVSWGITEFLILAYIFSTIIAEISRTHLDRKYKISIPNIMFISFVCGSLIGLFWSLINGSFSSILSLTNVEWGSVIYLGLIPSAIAIPKLQKLLSHKAGFPYVKTIEAGLKPILGYTSVGIVIYVFFGETLKPLTTNDYFALLMVLIGVSIAIFLGKPIQPEKK